MDNSNQIEEIKNRLDITQVVSKYVQLKQTGKNFSGLCPFHQEKSPSFIVSPEIQRYKCFGCGESGDIFNFVQKLENIDFPETLEKLAKEAGVELKKFEKNSKYKILEDINYIATKYYYKELKKDKVAYEYIKKRGFTDESIKLFGIGYAPKYPNLLNSLPKGSKYSKQELLDSGLFTDKYGTVKEKFYDRIMFPIRSSRGAVIGFTGRLLPNNDKGPKYMNTPDTSIFHKKFNLFGQYESRQEIRKQDLGILCEGSTDVISAHQAGIKNIVAPLGTGLTNEQLESLSHLTKNVLFFFDSDSAGQQALRRAFKIANELNLTPYAASPEPYKDIDELLQKDKNLLDSMIKDKQEAFSFILSKYVESLDLNKLEDLQKVRFFLNDLLSTLKDESTYEHYRTKVVSLLKVDFGVMKFEKAKENKGEIEKNKHVKKPIILPEKKYLQLLLTLGTLPEKYMIPVEFFKDPLSKKIYSQMLISKDLKAKSLQEIFNGDSELISYIDDLVLEDTENYEDPDKSLIEITRRLKKAHFTQEHKDLSIKIAIAEEKGDNELSEELLQKALELTKILTELEND